MSFYHLLKVLIQVVQIILDLYRLVKLLRKIYKVVKQYLDEINKS